jgi:hypothetical protein
MQHLPESAGNGAYSCDLRDVAVSEEVPFRSDSWFELRFTAGIL